MQCDVSSDNRPEVRKIYFDYLKRWINFRHFETLQSQLSTKIVELQHLKNYFVKKEVLRKMGLKFY